MPCKPATTLLFRIVVVMPYEPLNMQWNFFNNAALSPNNNIFTSNPVADSTFTNDGINYYLYRLPGDYTYSTTGDLNFLLTTAYPTQDGCFNYQQLSYTIDVLKKPVANWSLQYNHCALDTLYFKDSSVAYGSLFTQWQWNFGDNTSSLAANPVKNYAQYGDYDVSLRSITKTGCYADTAKKIHLNASPNADFSFSGNDCEKSILQFSDLSQK